MLVLCVGSRGRGRMVGGGDGMGWVNERDD